MPGKTVNGMLSLIALAPALFFFWASPAPASIITITTARNSVSLEQEEVRLQTLLERYGENQYFLNELGNISYRMGKLEKANALWAEAARNPNLPGPTVQLVFADLAANNLASAEKRLLELDSANSKDPHVHVAAAQLAMMKRQLDQAFSSLQTALKLSPELPVVLVSLGNWFELSGNDEKALELFDEAAQKDPRFTSPWLHQAMVHFRKGDVALAVDALHSAEESDVRQPLAESRVGELLLRKGDYFQARTWLSKALERNPDDHITRVLLGSVYQRVNRQDKAVAEYNKVLEKEEFVPALQSLAEIAYTEKKWEEASALYRRILAKNPDDIIACNNLAMLIVQTGENPLPPDEAVPGEVFSPENSGTARTEVPKPGSAAEAVMLIDRAMQNSANAPVMAQLRGTYGCVLWYAGRHELAETVLGEEVRGNGANQPWTRYCFARLLKDRGKQDLARENFEACLFLDKEFDRQDVIMRELGQ
jgi:tetratricopeptide (TPR) repeat protein